MLLKSLMIPGRLVSACFTGLRWKLLAGKAKEKVAFRLGSWLTLDESGAPDPSGWKVQSDSISGNRSPLYLCSFAPTKRVLSLLRMSRTSRRITSPRALPEPMSLDDQRSRAVASGCVGGSSKKRTPSSPPLSAVFE